MDAILSQSLAEFQRIEIWIAIPVRIDCQQNSQVTFTSTLRRSFASPEGNNTYGLSGAIRRSARMGGLALYEFSATRRVNHVFGLWSLQEMDIDVTRWVTFLIHTYRSRKTIYDLSTVMQRIHQANRLFANF